jgi:hypothetical protein
MSRSRIVLFLSCSPLLALGMLWGQGMFSAVSTALVARVPIVTNTPPVAHAGPHQTVAVGTMVHLDGSQSSDVDGDALSFQ